MTVKLWITPDDDQPWGTAQVDHRAVGCMERVEYPGGYSKLHFTKTADSRWVLCGVNAYFEDPMADMVAKAFRKGER